MNDNRLKSINGLISKSSLTEVLKALKENGIISSCSSSYRCGYGKNKDQFFAPFVIGFANQTKWLIFSTNSIRTDRMCIQQWNAENIKRIDQSVTKAIIVVPVTVRSNEKESHLVLSYKKKIKECDFYSAIDDVIYQDELAELLCNNS